MNKVTTGINQFNLYYGLNMKYMRNVIQKKKNPWTLNDPKVIKIMFFWLQWRELIGKTATANSNQGI